MVVESSWSSSRTIIAAVSPEGVIGLDGRIPWRYAGDLRRFKRLTLGGALIMGRLTWESLGARPLPGRRNLVVTGRDLEGVECFHDLAAALNAAGGSVWFIGGAHIYEEAMQVADRIDLTLVPDRVVDPRAVRFPAIDPSSWEAGPVVPHEDEPSLLRQEYRRRR